MLYDRPTFGSLFAGIGGIDLGLERAGWECRFQVEWDEYCQHVLAHHWPDVPRYGDITAVDWSGVERVDLLAGGFPCQPVSAAGSQRAQEDERWLWPEFARAIRALRPRYVLVENVVNLLAVNDGTAFGDVVGDLASSGYDAEWDCLPAAAFGAPHERDRLWLVAYPAGERPQAVHDQPSVFRQQAGATWIVGPTNGTHVDGRGTNGRGPVWATEPALRRVDDGFPRQLDRVHALGNAVVPQVVEYIGRRILEAEALT
jgi:DNA (cytosine-5)-methyltransferase 1